MDVQACGGKGGAVELDECAAALPEAYGGTDAQV